MTAALEASSLRPVEEGAQTASPRNAPLGMVRGQEPEKASVMVMPAIAGRRTCAGQAASKIAVAQLEGVNPAGRIKNKRLSWGEADATG